MRLATFRDKLQVYFLGLLTGLVLGGGFFVLKLDEYVKQFAFDKSSSEPVVQQDEGPAGNTVTKKQEKEKNSRIKKDKTRAVAADSASGPVLDADTLAMDSAGPGTAVFGRDNEDEIVVKKDELLSEKSIALVDLNGPQPRDSAVQKISGIREPQQKALQVEFWRSPLNYRGYKMSRSKLIIFGLDSDDEVALYKVDDDIYMKNRGGVFRLEPCTDFRQPERVSDASLIARLK